MTIHLITTYTVRLPNNASIDIFSTQTYLTADDAKTAARECRDRYNAANPPTRQTRITRSVTQRIIKPL